MSMKKIFSQIKIFVLLAAVSLATTSCLDKDPLSAIPQTEAMQSYEEAEQTLTGIYARLKSSALWSGYLTLLPDIQCDLVYAVDGYTNTYGSIWQWDIRPTTAEIESVYAALYGVISHCNFYLERIDAVVAKQTSDERIEALEVYTGEVYTIRALAYSELLKCFCKAYDPATAANELGVVIRKLYSTPEPAIRSSLKASYEFVLEDLARAEELLPIENDFYSHHYLTLGAAYALHARVALYMQDWEAAIDYSSRVIDHPNKAYALSSATTLYTQTMTYFDYMWAHDLSTEAIWQIGFTQTSFGGALGSVFLHFTTDYYYFYPDYVPAQWVLDLYDAGDRRYEAYFYDAQTGYDHALQWPLLVKYYGNRDFISSSYIYHVSMPKPFRLAEQYLIRAEAYCRQSSPDFTAATADLMTLRKARYISGGVLSLKKDNFIEEIANERVRELYMEGFRLHDIKRWGSLYRNGEGFTRVPQQQSLSEGSSISVKADNALFVWPIPQHEIEAPGSQIVPNESNK